MPLLRRAHGSDGLREHAPVARGLWLPGGTSRTMTTSSSSAMLSPVLLVVRRSKKRGVSEALVDPPGRRAGTVPPPPLAAPVGPPDRRVLPRPTPPSRSIDSGGRARRNGSGILKTATLPIGRVSLSPSVCRSTPSTTPICGFLGLGARTRAAVAPTWNFATISSHKLRGASTSGGSIATAVRATWRTRQCRARRAAHALSASTLTVGILRSSGSKHS